MLDGPPDPSHGERAAHWFGSRRVGKKRRFCTRTGHQTRPTVHGRLAGLRIGLTKQTRKPSEFRSISGRTGRCSLGARPWAASCAAPCFACAAEVHCTAGTRAGCLWKCESDDSVNRSSRASADSSSCMRCVIRCPQFGMSWDRDDVSAPLFLCTVAETLA